MARDICPFRKPTAHCLVLCPSCQHANPDGARFCLDCGHQLVARSGGASVEPERVALVAALGDKYDIIRLLGRGGMGAVYLARERALDRAVAIKVLPPSHSTDEATRERFRREARTAAKLTHPNIVPLYSVGEVDGMPYFVMGYVHGVSLGARLAQEGTIPPEDVRRIITQLADALDYAHRQGVVHRDIKPDNVMLDDESGRPMLTDFGVAKAGAVGETLTQAGMVLGTPHYMSPEQASADRDIDGRSDLYSLAVMGYVMLSGRLPFDGDSARDIIVQHLLKAPPSLRTMVRDLPDDLESALSRALAKDPGDRWPNGRSMAAALGDIGSDEDTDASLTSITGTGTSIVIGGIIAVVMGAFSWMTLPVTHPTHAGGRLPPWWLLSTIVAAVSLLPIVGIAIWRRAQGERWHDIIRKVMRPARWWVLAWPKQWRRTGDVWERLPKAIKVARHLFAWAQPLFLVSLTCMLTSFKFYANEVVPPAWIERALFVSTPAGFALCLIASVVAKAFLRTTALNHVEQDKVLLTPTWRLDVWGKPKYAAILLPPRAGQKPAVAEPVDARGYLKAIVDCCAALTGPAAELCEEAAASARQIVAAIELLEREMAILEKDANPAELAQVNHKLASMSEDGASPDRKALYQMLLSQRELLVRLSGRLSEVTRRRDHLRDLLKTLWLQVANVRATVARDARAAADVTGRIRLVLGEIGAFEDALGTLAMTATPGDAVPNEAAVSKADH